MTALARRKPYCQYVSAWVSVRADVNKLLILETYDVLLLSSPCATDDNRIAQTDRFRRLARLMRTLASYLRQRGQSRRVITSYSLLIWPTRAQERERATYSFYKVRVTAVSPQQENTWTVSIELFRADE